MLSGDVRFGSKAGILFSQQNVRYVTEADVGESEDRSAGAKRGTQQAGHADGKDRPTMTSNTRAMKIEPLSSGKGESPEESHEANRIGCHAAEGRVPRAGWRSVLHGGRGR